MKQESTQELLSRKLHEPFLVLVSGVSPTERNLVIDE